LHSKQNSEINTENGDKAEKAEHRKNLNPFATEEDDDSDNEDNDRDFSIGDLDVEDDGKGLLGVGGKEESSLEDGKGSKNVGIPNPASVLSSSTSTTHPLGIGRASFPSMWPFGGNSSPKGNFAVADESENHDGHDHFTGSSANIDDVQSSDSDNSSDEEIGYGDRALGGTDFGADGQEGFSGSKRRLSVTTEAKRRTCLEDDDDEDEEVVHVAMAEADAEAGKEAEKNHASGEGDDEELVEIQHAEMHGVEGEAK
jgi:hypothetical protein